MRVVHLTDLHFHAPAGARQLLGKRALGRANLFFRGRSAQFGGESRDAVVDDVLALEPDLVVITGDLTALATEAEFAAARTALAPLLTTLPVAMVAGNHDRYTRGSARSRRMERHFGPWMTGGRWDPASRAWRPPADPGPAPALFTLDDLELVMLDTARPSLVSRGALDRPQRERLEALLAAPAAGHRLLGLHYPLLDREGAPYVHRTHGLLGVETLIEVVRRHPVDAVLHGHVHHWWAGALTADDGRRVPVLNGGSSGLAPGGSEEPGYLVLGWETGGTLSITRRCFRDGTYRPEPVPLPAPG